MKYIKQLFVLLLFTSFKNSAKCQVVDSCFIRCEYSFRFQSDSLNVLSVGDDVMVLEIGENYSVYYSRYRKTGDSLIEENTRRGLAFADMVASGQNYYRNKLSTVVTKNIQENTLTVTENLMEPYIYTEPLESQDWKILNDTAMLNGLHCQKAVTDFRGRSYTAWFTKDVAVQNGPWKFYGLPGLIVKVNDSKHQFEFELNHIEAPGKRTAIVIPQKNYVHTTRKAFWNLKKQMADDPIGFGENLSSVKVIPASTMSPQERKAYRKPFNPLELE